MNPAFLLSVSAFATTVWLGGTAVRAIGTIVAREENEGVVFEVVFLELGQQFAHGVVNSYHRSFVGGSIAAGYSIAIALGRVFNVRVNGEGREV